MKPVLISSGSGSGSFADEVLLASAVRLLARLAPAPVLALSSDPPRSARSHPGMRCVPEEEVDGALDAAALLVVVGDLSRPTRLARAAAQLVRAKWARVPVALVAVRLPQSDGAPPGKVDLGKAEPAKPEPGKVDPVKGEAGKADSGKLDLGKAPALAADPADARANGVFLPLLSQAESVSACDRESARVLAALSGKRVETTAPLEILLEIDVPRSGASCTIGIGTEVLSAGASCGLLEALEQASASWGARVIAIAPPGVEPPPRFECCATPDWNTWLDAALACDVLVDAADSTLLVVAAAHGVRPLALVRGSRRPDLHGRLGLGALVVPWDAGAEAFTAALQQAQKQTPDAVRARCAPLRSVAWRALGPLADATRSRPLQLHGLRPEALALVTAAREARAHAAPRVDHAPAPQRGDGGI